MLDHKGEGEPAELSTIGPKGLGRGYEVEERPGRDSLFIW